MVRTDAVLQEGYKKYSRGPFKVAMFDRWVVFVSNRDAVEDVGRRPDSELSVSESTKELFETAYTVVKETNNDQWHVDIIRSKFSRDLSSIVLDIVDELPLAVVECFQGTEGRFDGDIKASVQKLVARMSGRVCVDVPTCRSSEYTALVIRSSESIMKDAFVLKVFPDALKPTVARLASSTRSCMAAAASHIEEIYRSRKEQSETDAQEKPNDVLQWFIDGAPARASDEDIIHRVLAIHLTAIHTSSTAITQALSDLASYPEHAEVIRAEVETVVAADGWTKAAIDNMRKLDSFLKESQRCNCVVPFVSLRKAMDDLTLTDGTFLPKGTMVAAVASPIHHDASLYPSLHTFDPFRFSSMFDAEGPSVTQRFTHTSARWLTFGYGRHACPGRFFAADMVKAVVAHMVLKYNLKVQRDTDGMRSGLGFGLKPSAKLGGKVIMERRKAETGT
ncbi:cytochrome P450 [Polyporus arcularius HHB13444]|uniref:Cytochrome P450 n=1 Tax=Polyporus arcularius HHB13444 TaxID=1314778 RepID=A0A5C3PVS0_9APHY|nr:cytochrome P450 [Polyporus arcularius HHB13444]